MKTFNSVNELLDFAIGEEEKAAQFYTDLASKTNRSGTQDLFHQFSREEMGHKARLLEIKNGKQFDHAAGKILDLKLAEYLVDVPASPQLNYQEALILAMKREKAAFRIPNCATLYWAWPRKKPSTNSASKWSMMTKF